MDHAVEISRQVPTQGATLRLAGAAQKYNRRSLEGFLPLSTLIQSLSPSKRSLVCRTVNLPRYLVHGGRSSPFHEIVKIGTLSQWGYIPTSAVADPRWRAIGELSGNWRRVSSVRREDLQKRLREGHQRQSAGESRKRRSGHGFRRGLQRPETG